MTPSRSGTPGWAFSMNSRYSATAASSAASARQGVAKLPPATIRGLPGSALSTAPSLASETIFRVVPPGAQLTVRAGAAETSRRSTCTTGCRGCDHRAQGRRSLLPGTSVAALMLVVKHADRVGGGLRAALHAQLGEQRRHVVLHRLLGQEHPLADLPVGQPLPDQLQDRALLGGQAS